MKFARCIFLMTSLALMIPHIQAVESSQELIDTICRETEDYEFCNEIIQKNANASTANLHDLTDHIIILSMKHASDTYTFIGNILRKRHESDEETAGLNTCLGVYNSESTIFVIVHEHFYLREYERMILAILSTTKILKDCKTDFPVPPNKENPLIEKNREMRILITMSTVSGYMLINGNHSLLSSVVTGLEVSQ
ncbi:unnamed protein product [Arabis nemorensis]|uniref:Pectinesterase inhibitor domain-containing protein n=1 Tax=Arabis nemorensis TaxID=586526 RepID=A0A565AMX6_9BRAS|nr:unnamed protein product [Arabis nemorensis]